METYKSVTTRHRLAWGADNVAPIENALESEFGFAPDHIRSALARNLWLNLELSPHHVSASGRKGFTVTWGTTEVARSLADLDRQLKSAFTHLHEFEARRQRLGLSSKPSPVS